MYICELSSLSHSRFSISPSLPLYNVSACRRRGVEIKQVDSRAGVDQLVVVPLVTHGSGDIYSHIHMLSVDH